MAYNELIKNFEKVRAYMREFYVYGFKSRTEYDAKSVRSYDDERRRLESWLGDYMLHFAHFEKQAERTDDGRYILRLKYYENDETEIVIRVLSFGPYVKVLEPESFVNLIKERLISQKSCELK